LIQLARKRVTGDWKKSRYIIDTKKFTTLYRERIALMPLYLGKKEGGGVAQWVLGVYLIDSHAFRYHIFTPLESLPEETVYELYLFAQMAFQRSSMEAERLDAEPYASNRHYLRFHSFSIAETLRSDLDEFNDAVAHARLSSGRKLQLTHAYTMIAALALAENRDPRPFVEALASNATIEEDLYVWLKRQWIEPDFDQPGSHAALEATFTFSRDWRLDSTTGLYSYYGFFTPRIVDAAKAKYDLLREVGNNVYNAFQLSRDGTSFTIVPWDAQVKRTTFSVETDPPRTISNSHNFLANNLRKEASDFAIAEVSQAREEYIAGLLPLFDVRYHGEENAAREPEVSLESMDVDMETVTPEDAELPFDIPMLPDIHVDEVDSDDEKEDVDIETISDRRKKQPIQRPNMITVAADIEATQPVPEPSSPSMKRYDFKPYKVPTDAPALVAPPQARRQLKFTTLGPEDFGAAPQPRRRVEVVDVTNSDTEELPPYEPVEPPQRVERKSVFLPGFGENPNEIAPIVDVKSPPEGSGAPALLEDPYLVEFDEEIAFVEDYVEKREAARKRKIDTFSGDINSAPVLYIPGPGRPDGGMPQLKHDIGVVLSHLDQLYYPANSRLLKLALRAIVYAHCDKVTMPFNPEELLKNKIFLFEEGQPSKRPPSELSGFGYQYNFVHPSAGALTYTTDAGRYRVARYFLYPQWVPKDGHFTAGKLQKQMEPGNGVWALGVLRRAPDRVDERDEPGGSQQAVRPVFRWVYMGREIPLENSVVGLFLQARAKELIGPEVGRNVDFDYGLEQMFAFKSYGRGEESDGVKYLVNVVEKLAHGISPLWKAIAGDPVPSNREFNINLASVLVNAVEAYPGTTTHVRLRPGLDASKLGWIYPGATPARRAYPLTVDALRQFVERKDVVPPSDMDVETTRSQKRRKFEETESEEVIPPPRAPSPPALPPSSPDRGAQEPTEMDIDREVLIPPEELEAQREAERDVVDIASSDEEEEEEERQEEREEEKEEEEEQASQRKSSSFSSREEDEESDNYAEGDSDYGKPTELDEGPDVDDPSLPARFENKTGHKYAAHLFREFNRTAELQKYARSLDDIALDRWLVESAENLERAILSKKIKKVFMLGAPVGQVTKTDQLDFGREDLAASLPFDEHAKDLSPIQLFRLSFVPAWNLTEQKIVAGMKNEIEQIHRTDSDEWHGRKRGMVPLLRAEDCILPFRCVPDGNAVRFEVSSTFGREAETKTKLAELAYGKYKLTLVRAVKNVDPGVGEWDAIDSYSTVLKMLDHLEYELEKKTGSDLTSLSKYLMSRGVTRENTKQYGWAENVTIPKDKFTLETALHACLYQTDGFLQDVQELLSGRFLHGIYETRDRIVEAGIMLRTMFYYATKNAGGETVLVPVVDQGSEGANQPLFLPTLPDISDEDIVTNPTAPERRSPPVVEISSSSSSSSSAHSNDNKSNASSREDLSSISEGLDPKKKQMLKDYVHDLNHAVNMVKYLTDQYSDDLGAETYDELLQRVAKVGKKLEKAIVEKNLTQLYVLTHPVGTVNTVHVTDESARDVSKLNTDRNAKYLGLGELLSVATETYPFSGYEATKTLRESLEPTIKRATFQVMRSEDSGMIVQVQPVGKTVLFTVAQSYVPDKFVNLSRLGQSEFDGVEFQFVRAASGLRRGVDVASSVKPALLVLQNAQSSREDSEGTNMLKNYFKERGLDVNSEYKNLQDMLKDPIRTQYSFISAVFMALSVVVGPMRGSTSWSLADVRGLFNRAVLVQTLVTLQHCFYYEKTFPDGRVAFVSVFEKHFPNDNATGTLYHPLPLEKL
jgi:hypothetical protein